MPNKKKNIVLGVTGSIAAYKSADLIRRLQDKQFQVSVILTKEAQKFITALTLASLCGKKVYQDMFDEKEHSWEMNHIRLAREADLFLIAPATANIIGKAASGIADDLITCTALATKAPIVMAPAMNDEMFHNKIVQGNIEKLEKLGVKFIRPVEGKLACGVFGEGHFAEVEDIVNEVQTLVH